MTEVLVEKLVVAGQSVLTLIAELKRQALLSDFPALNSAVAARQRDHEAVLEAAEQKIQHLAAEAQVKRARLRHARREIYCNWPNYPQCAGATTPCRGWQRDI